MIDPPRVLSEELTAVTPHGGFCGGESQQWLSYPTNLHAGSALGNEFKKPRSLGKGTGAKGQITARLRKGLPLQGSSLPSSGFDLRLAQLAQVYAAA